MNYYLLFSIGLCTLIKASCCNGHQCKNVSKTLYAINGGTASTSFYSDNFVELRCYSNDNIVFNSGNVLPSSRFRLEQTSNLFTIVTSNVTTGMNETYRCLVLETLCIYNITIQFKIHVDEVQLSVIPISSTDGKNTIDATNGYVVLKCHSTSPYLYTSLEFHFNSSMEAQLVYEGTSATNDLNLFHAVKILALKTDETHDNEAIFCSADHNITNASTTFNSPTLKLNTYRCNGPEPIRSIRIKNVTANSLILEWESNTVTDCSGTIFVVECITPLPSIWSEPIEIESNNSSDKQSLSIEYLNPGTEYGFVIYSRNHNAESGGSYIFSKTKDTDNCTVYFPQSYMSTINENDFTVTEIASIVLAFLVGCITAGCVIYISTQTGVCWNNMDKSSQNNNLDSTNYQTSITHTQNPVFEQPPGLHTPCEMVSNEYTNTTAMYHDIGGQKYDTTIQRSAAAAASTSRCQDVDDDDETYHVIKDQNLVYHSVF